MPELPDVEVFRRYLDATALHQEIAGVDIRAKRLLRGISLRRFERALQGNQFEATHRHGKYLFIGMRDGALLVHFGMTGRLKYFKRIEDDPEHDQLLFSFTGGYHLAYISQRKLGRVGIVDSPEDFIERKGLGPDALSIDRDTLGEVLADAGAALKSTLMNQSRIAGIGNIYSDEILFRARLHPKARSDRLNGGQLKRLHRALGSVLRTAVDRKADPDALPSSYLLPNRERGGSCPRCGGTVKRIAVSGRNGWYCPRCQKK